MHSYTQYTKSLIKARDGENVLYPLPCLGYPEPYFTSPPKDAVQAPTQILELSGLQQTKQNKQSGFEKSQLKHRMYKEADTSQAHSFCLTFISSTGVLRNDWWDYRVRIGTDDVSDIISAVLPYFFM